MDDTPKIVFPLSQADLARHMGVSRKHINNALKAQERAQKAGRAYKGRVPLPTGYKDGKPYWIIEDKKQEE